MIGTCVAVTFKPSLFSVVWKRELAGDYPEGSHKPSEIRDLVELGWEWIGMPIRYSENYPESGEHWRWFFRIKV